MFKRYELQVVRLEETLQRDHEVVWHHSAYRWSEKSLRKLFWQKVNLLQHSPLIYRMYDNQEKRVIE